MGEQISKAALARRLGVSRGALYYQKKLPDKDEELRQAIEAVMLKNPAYGHRRIADALGINRKRIRRVMRLFNLKPARRCRTGAPSKPEDVGQQAAIYPDITKKLSPIVPNFLWVSDFTFISFHGTFVYLATIIDRFTREVLGANIMTSHSVELIDGAFKQALENTGTVPEWFHSDQGSEYKAGDFIQWHDKLGINISMTPKSSPWRNGAQESFFGRFKIEFGDPDRFDTLPELIEEIYASIAYYNQERIHTALRMAPLQFKAIWHAKRAGQKPQQPLTVYPKKVQSPPELCKYLPLRHTPPEVFHMN